MDPGPASAKVEMRDELERVKSLAAAVQPRIVISGSCLECGYEGDQT